jgi:hypothetical protein
MSFTPQLRRSLRPGPASGDPKQDEHEELPDWIGGNFDRDAFPVDEVNCRLAPLQRRSKAAAGKK